MPHDKKFVIRLNAFDLGQLIDGLEVRAQAWRDTASYLETGQLPSPDFVMEECTGAEEAQKLADHYESILTQVMEQKAHQNPS
ncbi:MAG: hypothetical protein IPL52_11425 [Flavobacteriales bacterium]|nr:hypothetical protein [Flavobacteriales bacterium]